MKARRLPLFFPTASFAGLLFVLGAMWYAASSQNSPAVYLLLFALTAVFLVSIPHTVINLAGVRVALESAQPAFAGQEVSLPVEISNSSRAARHGIELALSGSSRDRERIDYIPADKAARMTLRFPARQRGEHEIGALRLTSVYPLGFIRVSKKFASAQTYTVYPKPEGDPQLPLNGTSIPRSRLETEIGEGDDFAGVRAYVPGESQRHIDWRLSQLALWVIEAERDRRPYGLRLPGTEIPPAVGQVHFHQCLRALSLFQVGMPGSA